jgi:ankyrin repeat protein/L-ascorbate metabolism protein UlaG (beta-lactamase superfamily)
MTSQIRVRPMALLLALAVVSALATQVTIFEAAESGDLETVSRLLKADPKLVEATNAEGDTALHLAAGCRRGEPAALPIIRLLLEGGANVEARNASGQTPILYSSYAGFRQAVELFLDKGATFRYQDRNGRTPLHYAAREGKAAVVEVLIGRGAETSVKDNQGRTPLEYAALQNRAAVLEVFLRLARYDAKGPEGSILLHAAASQGHEDMVVSLLAKGADPDRPGPGGEPILLGYLRGGLGARAVAEIARGADVNAKDASGRTALHLAVDKGLDDAAKALLDKGADANAVDGNGVTPLEIAQDWGADALASLLAAKGARTVQPKAHVLGKGSYEIADPGPGRETAVIRYIGTDGFLIRAGGKGVLVDGLVQNPWGYTNTPERALEMMKARRPPFERLDLLLFSHAHRDHFEPRMALDVLAAQEEAVLMGDTLVDRDLRETGPVEAKRLAARIKVLDLRVGHKTALAVNGVPLTVLGVNHADREPAYLTLGYIMDLGPFRIYHQGDLYPPVNMAFLSEVPWEEMGIDIAFFDPFFLQDDAARKMVLERIRPSAVILMHMREDEGARLFGELRPAVPQVLFFRGPMESKRFVKASGQARRP